MRIYFLLLLSVVFFSCKTKHNACFEKVWFYDDELTEQEQLENLRKYGGATEYRFSAASFLNLQPNGKFTSYLSAFDYGDWKQRDSTLILTTHNKGKLFLEVKHVTPKQMVCINRTSHKVFRFNGFVNGIASEQESPFALIIYGEQSPLIMNLMLN